MDVKLRADLNLKFKIAFKLPQEAPLRATTTQTVIASSLISSQSDTLGEFVV
jgi:hypothetical protein